MAKAKGNPEILKKITADAKKIRAAGGTTEKKVTTYSMKWGTAVKKAAAKYRRENATDAPIERKPAAAKKTTTTKPTTKAKK